MSRGARRSCKRKGSCAGIQPKRGSSTEPHSIMCLMATKSPERAARTKQELQPYCGCGALQRSSPFLQTSASSVSDRTRKTVTIDVARRAPCRRASDACTAAFAPARPAALNLFFLLFDGFELFMKSSLHCAFQPLLMMRIGIITCGVVPDELVPQYGT